MKKVTLQPANGFINYGIVTRSYVKNTHHFQTFTISSSEPVTIVSVTSASLLPHAAVQIASSCAERKQTQVDNDSENKQRFSWSRLAFKTQAWCFIILLLSINAWKPNQVVRLWILSDLHPLSVVLNNRIFESTVAYSFR